MGTHDIPTIVAHPTPASQRWLGAVGRSASPSLSLKPMFEPLTPVRHGSYETAAAPAESSRKKQFRIFRLPCAGGGRILPYFSGIIVVSSDMTYHYLSNYALGLLRRTEQRIIARSKTGGSGIL